MNTILSLKNFFLAIAFVSIVTLVSAVYIEFVLGAKPCKLCVYQRIPYVLTILVGLLLYFSSKIRLYLILTILFQTLGLGISIFHSLIERGIIHYEMGCTSVKNDFESIDELRNFLDAAPITKCNEINFSFLGLSLANMNILVSVLIIFLTTLYFIDHEKKK